MKKPLITFYMRAYNAEHYIEKSIESVLNQSLGDIEFILINNASTDRTGDICRRYAKADSRIVYHENEKNTILHPEYEGKGSRPIGEYYSYLDADDYLDIDYGKTMYEIAQKNNADMVVCGTEMFMNLNPNAKIVRVPPVIVTTDMSSLSEEFIELYGSLRTLWGKLYRTEFLLKHFPYVSDRPKWLISGSDTFSVLRYLKKCKSFVAIDKALYHYRIYEDSYYNKNISVNRVLECSCLYREGIELLEHWKTANVEVTNFLQDIHLNSITDCMQNAIQNTSESLKERLQLIQAIITDDLFCSYALLDKNMDTTFEVVGDCVKVMLSNVSDIKIAQVSNLFITRIYKTITQREYMNRAEIVANIFSALCDVNNKHIWGMNCIEKFKRLLPQDFILIMERVPEYTSELLKQQTVVRSILNGDYYIAYNIIKEHQRVTPVIQKILDILELLYKQTNVSNMLDTKNRLKICIDKGDIETAVELLVSVIDNRILDRDGLYFKIYIAWQIGDKALAIETAEVAAIFWYDDPDMMALCGDVFTAIEYFERAKWFYYKAIEVAYSEEFKIDINIRINENCNDY